MDDVEDVVEEPASEVVTKAPLDYDDDPIELGGDEAFNEDELAEIMNEIEDIEEDDESEVEGSNESSTNVEASEENVVPISGSSGSAPSMPSNASFSGGTPVSLAASGTMDVNLNFKVNEKDISLTVDKDSGFSLSLDNLNMSVDENNQLTLHLPGGIKFSVPLDDSGKNEKKKVA